VIFKSDSSRNIQALADRFKTITGVSGADPQTSYNDTRDITDSVNAAFTDLNYSFGWGTCENGCDHRATWKFRVFTDCSVQYMGYTGEALYTNISEVKGEEFKIFPNPANGSVTVLSGSYGVEVAITDLRARTVLQSRSESKASAINLEGLDNGIYFLKVASGDKIHIQKLIRY
jgi:hypothetical protein